MEYVDYWKISLDGSMDEEDFIHFNEHNMLVSSEGGMIVFNAIDDLLPYIKENESAVDSIMIVPFMVEHGWDNFEDKLNELVEYAIYDNQKLLKRIHVISPYMPLYEIAVKVAEKNCRYIDSIDDEWPNPEVFAMTGDTSTMKFSIPVNDAIHYWLTWNIESENVLVQVPLDEYGLYDQEWLDKYNTDENCIRGTQLTYTQVTLKGTLTKKKSVRAGSIIGGIDESVTSIGLQYNCKYGDSIIYY